MAKYGTVARIKCKPGRDAGLISIMNEWDRDFRPTVTGALNSYVYQIDGKKDEYILVAVFADQKSYLQNADNPAQDKWYQRMREVLVSDPEWSDGPIIYES